LLERIWDAWKSGGLRMAAEKCEIHANRNIMPGLTVIWRIFTDTKNGLYLSYTGRYSFSELLYTLFSKLFASRPFFALFLFKPFNGEQNV
jgi:hypothetical protein